LESHGKNEQNFAALKASIETLPDLLRPQENDDTSCKTPLIVIIDELDRCRPDFALGIIETLKHFFRANRVHFVLVTNRRHLELSVANRYGISEAAQEYLEKFYDFSIFFEQSYEKHRDGNVDRFVSGILNQLIPESSDRRDIVTYVQGITRAYKLSLRQISALSTNISISFLAARERELRPAALISFLALLKSRRPDLYKLAKQSSLTQWGSDFDIDRVKTLFEYYLSVEIDSNDRRFEGYGSATWNYNLERGRVIPYLTESILDRFGAPSTTP
jgi:hypothetical protein